MSKGPVTPNNERFAEIFGGLLYELLRAGGVNMQPIGAHERIREVGRKLASTIEFHAERKAVDVARKLQVAVKEAFEAYEKENADLKVEVNALKDHVMTLID